MRKFLGILVLLTSCSKIYYRPTDLHHASSTSLKIKDKNTVVVTVNKKGEISDTTINYIRCGIFEDTFIRKECLIFLEHRKVIRFDSSYWIKEGTKNKRIIEGYINQDIKF